MSYPTPMDVAETEDSAINALDAALDWPYSREAWDQIDAERLELLAANDGLAAEILHLRGLLSEVLAADKYDWNMGLEDRVREACQP